MYLLRSSVDQPRIEQIFLIPLVTRSLWSATLWRSLSSALIIAETGLYWFVVHTKVTTSLSINTIPHKKTNYKCTNCTNFGIHDVLFLYILPIDKTAEMCYNRKYLALRPSARRQKGGISTSCLYFLHYLIIHHQTLSGIARNSFVIAYAIPLLISAKSYFFNFNDFIVLSFS